MYRSVIYKSHLLNCFLEGNKYMNDLFLTNYTKIRFLDKIKDSLLKCKSFSFSVSFIKYAGLKLIEREIIEALENGAKGRIITSTYQFFTDTLSLKTFLNWMKKYKNFECHLDYRCFGDNGFHSKGYLFKYDDANEFIVGSSNLTRFALLNNIEWNVSLYSNEKFSSKTEAEKEFNELWNKTFLLDEKLIDKYSLEETYAIEKWDMDYCQLSENTIKPNSMQRKALKELRRNRDEGVTKSLIVSATGSGKTYLAAFDAKNYDAKRLLYVVHRDAILQSAKETFIKVFNAERTYGIYTGKDKDLNAEFIFTTNTMMAKHLSLFKKDEFDYIILDECHHATSNTYKSIMEYFTPGFYLGLTATPERMDNEDVFSLFENNVPFELRLRDAIINDLIVPFHYYAIRDEFINYSDYDKGKIAREITKEINVEFIADQIEKHKKQDEKLKCIAFCTSIEHAKVMASQLSLQGYETCSLLGNNNLGERIKAFNDLQNENNPLQIICAVDILNEGIDIPSINMVLFLRPTESSTIFLQQLGRGLRKYTNKEYLTVLDFIGNNYDRSIQIALALGSLGKTTYTEKSYLKDLIVNNYSSLQIPGVEIFFDDLSKTEIISHLEKVNFNQSNFLKQDYLNFKKYLKLDSYPSHKDYLNCEISPDLMRFIKSKINNQKNKSYYSFLKKIGEETLPIFSSSQIELLDNISELLPLVRDDEYLIIKQILNGDNNIELLIHYNNKVTKETLHNAYIILEKKNILKDGKLNTDSINDEFKVFLNDLLEYGINRCDIEFGEYEGKFKILGNYYKEQISMVRLKEKLMNVKGTEFDEVTKETYCYVGLNKDSNTIERLKYKDKFIDSKTFQWESENNTTLDNSIGKKILATKKVHLFVRKIKEEDGITLPFTYFGTGRFTNIRESFTLGTKKVNGVEIEVKSKTLLMDIILDTKVDKAYYLDFNIPTKDE